MTCCSVGGKHSDSMQLALPWLGIRGEVYNWPRPPQQQIFFSLLNIIDVDFDAKICAIILNFVSIMVLNPVWLIRLVG